MSRAGADAVTVFCRLATIAAQIFGIEVVPTRHAANNVTAVSVGMTVNGVEIPLLVQASLLRRVARSFFELPTDCRIPDALVGAALEASAGPWIERLEQAAGIELAVQDLDMTETAVEAPALQFSLTGFGDGGFVAVANLPGQALPSLPSVKRTDLDWLALLLPVVFAEVDVMTGELKQLAIGDVVVLPGARRQDIVEVRLDISPGSTITATIDGRRMTVAGLRKSMSTTDAPSGAARPSAAVAHEPLVPPAAIDDITVTIVVDFGDLKLTLAELRSLVPGQVIDLAQPAGSSVRLSVNGQRIGAGEIVDVEGRLGVRVTELASKV